MSFLIFLSDFTSLHIATLQDEAGHKVVDGHTFRNADDRFTHYDDDAESDIYTDTDHEDDQGDWSHRRDVSKLVVGSELDDDDDRGVEYDPSGSMVNVGHHMGASMDSIHGFGGNNRVRRGRDGQDLGDSEEYYTDDTGGEYEDETDYSSGNQTGTDTDEDEDLDPVEYEAMQRQAGLPIHGGAGNESFSVVSGGMLQQQRSYSHGAGMGYGPPMDYDDDDESYEDEAYSDEDQ